MGEVTPPAVWSVATRLAVRAAPALVRTRETVTGSPGSMAEFLGTRSSTKTAPAARMLGAGFAAVVTRVAELLAELGSDENVVTAAELVSRPALFGATTMVSAAEAAGERVPRLVKVS